MRLIFGIVYKPDRTMEWWVVFETYLFLGTLIRSIGRGHEWVVFELYLYHCTVKRLPLKNK